MPTQNEINGIGASPGIGIGKAVVRLTKLPEIVRQTLLDHEVEAEVTRLEAIVGDAKGQIEHLRQVTAERMSEAEAQIFDAHLAFLGDPSYVGEMYTRIRNLKQNAQAVCEDITSEMYAMLSSLPDDYLRARADDIRDVGNRLLLLLSGETPFDPGTLPDGSIVVAEELTPSDLARFSTSVVGMVTGKGSKTGHAAIMARTLGIPAVLGVGEHLSQIQNGDVLIIDGDEGVITLRPEATLERTMKEKLQEQQNARTKALERANADAVTADGMRIQAFANIGSLHDVDAALENGAEGVGLFRTEFLYIENNHWPTEEEQFEVYRTVLERFGGRPIIIRTLDIGGDKELPYAKLPTEDNPFLGERAIRFCLARPEIFKVQLRALLRASVHGTLWIMLPMISTIEEVRQSKDLLEECRAELRGEGLPFADDIPVGIMVETPAAAVTADIFAKEVSFFSIGTNDLTQYTLAADRGNENVEYLYQAYHPAVLRMIELVCRAANQSGIPIGVCGELAGDKRFTETLIGLGVNELSMGARSIPVVKETIRGVEMKAARGLAQDVIHQANAKDVDTFLENRRPS